MDCPKCGRSGAYIGLKDVECENPHCEHYTEKAPCNDSKCGPKGSYDKKFPCDESEWCTSECKQTHKSWLQQVTDMCVAEVYNRYPGAVIKSCMVWNGITSVSFEAYGQLVKTTHSTKTGEIYTTQVLQLGKFDPC